MFDAQFFQLVFVGRLMVWSRTMATELYAKLPAMQVQMLVYVPHVTGTSGTCSKIHTYCC